MGGLGNKQVMAKNIQKRMDAMVGMFIAIIPRLTMI